MATLYAVIYLLLLGFLMALFWNSRKIITHEAGMTIAMVIGTGMGFAAGSLAPFFPFVDNFYQAVSLGALGGIAAGTISGAIFHLTALLEGLFSGLMGGMMGTMLTYMVPPSYHTSTIQMVAVLYSSTFLLLLLLLHKQLQAKKLHMNGWRLFHSFVIISTIITFLFVIWLLPFQPLPLFEGMM